MPTQNNWFSSDLLDNSKPKITKEKRIDPEEGYVYKMQGSDGFADVEVLVGAEIGGHGCLFDITLPPMSIYSGSHSGSKSQPLFEDVMKVLNEVMRDYNMNSRAVKHVLKNEEF